MLNKNQLKNSKRFTFIILFILTFVNFILIFVHLSTNNTLFLSNLLNDTTKYSKHWKHCRDFYLNDRVVS